MKTTSIFRTRALVGALLAMGVGVASTAQAGPMDLSGPYNLYQTYGNLNSYSLPILAGVYDGLHGGGVGPGNPYYVASSPGNIKDLVVVYTGANGVDVTTNAAGFENAYLTPSGSSPNYASMNGAVNVVDPGAKAGIANATADTWDASLLAMKGFLAGGDPVFLFNNNDTNKDQNLAIWAKLWLTDGNNAVYSGRYLYLSNGNAVYGDGGIPFGDAATYNPGGIHGVEPAIDYTTRQTDYVLSGGAVCLGATGDILPCGSTGAGQPINHNLGANQAAYAGLVPVLNDWLDTLFALSDTDLNKYTFHLDLRLGCAPAWQTTLDSGHKAVDDCANIKIDNGYEQLFLASTSQGVPVPEPATSALFGLGLISMWLIARRYRYCRA